jgi:hypothetical protein
MCTVQLINKQTNKQTLRLGLCNSSCRGIIQLNAIRLIMVMMMVIIIIIITITIISGHGIGKQGAVATEQDGCYPTGPVCCDRHP